MKRKPLSVMTRRRSPPSVMMRRRKPPSVTMKRRKLPSVMMKRKLPSVMTRRKSPPSVMMKRRSLPSVMTRRKSLPSEMTRRRSPPSVMTKRRNPLSVMMKRNPPSQLMMMRRRKPHSWNYLTINSTSSTSIMLRCSTKETGPPIKNQDHMIMTAQSPNQTTGRVPNNALNHGNAEVPQCAKEEDGAQDSMDVKDLHSQPKLQGYRTLIEK